MSELSESIRVSFDNVLKIYEQVASLILDVDDLMQRRGYRNLGGSGIESPYSKRLDYPRWWLCGSAVRHYVSEMKIDIARSIGVFFVDARMQTIEPLVVMAVLKGEVEESTEEVDPTWMLWDAWNKQIPDQSLNKDHIFKNFKKIQQGKIKAILLEEVKDHDSLESLVIEPLLSMDWK